MYLVFEDFDFASGSSANTALNGIGYSKFWSVRKSKPARLTTGSLA
jgi:hypothetical protein